MRRLTTLLLPFALLVPALSGQGRRRVAVLDFDYATVQTTVAAVFGTNREIGKGITDLLVNDLVADGAYSVVERKAIERVLAEQNFSNSDRADASTAAKLGRILGVDAIIMGSITRFGSDDRTTSVGGDVVKGALGRYGLGGVGRRNAKAVCDLSARLISTDTAEILAVGTGTGTSSRTGTSLLGSGGGSTSATGAVDVSSSNFRNTLIGEAVTKAVSGLARELSAMSTRMPTKVTVVEGLVADATGGTLVLNVGSKAGVKVGDRLAVLRGTRTIKDPETGKTLRRIEDRLGEVTVTEVDERSAVGTYAGANPAKVGDAVRSTPQ